MDYTVRELQEILGNQCYEMYQMLNDYILDHYNVDPLWDKGGEVWRSLSSLQQE